MKYDPLKHHRHSIRLQGYDYAQQGAYFVTIVTHNRECLFDDKVLLRVIETYWQMIPKHFPNVILDEWVVMPNHIHGGIVIADDACRGEAFLRDSSSDNLIANKKGDLSLKHTSGNASPLPPRGALPNSLGAVIGNFKSMTTRRINVIRHTQGASVWQRNYYEHIIRDEKELDRIREYIINNPANWDMDDENPKQTRTQR